MPKIVYASTSSRPRLGLAADIHYDGMASALNTDTVALRGADSAAEICEYQNGSLPAPVYTSELSRARKKQKVTGAPGIGQEFISLTFDRILNRKPPAIDFFALNYLSLGENPVHKSSIILTLPVSSLREPQQRQYGTVSSHLLCRAELPRASLQLE
ncbi:hypothetical protein B0H19DRAFT_1236969 [Mycena capillaripes]|nr:hypothetical protein B0H19DRAFT_1236969 [Mycena capillaripes]